MHSAAIIQRSVIALSGLAGASGALVASRVIGMATSFLFTLVLARVLSPADVGAVLTIMSGAFLISLFVTMNIESGSIRFVVAAKENGQEAAARGFLWFGRFMIIAISPFAITGFYFAFHLWGGETTSRYDVLIWLAAAAIPIMGWLRFSGSIATAVGAPLKGSAPRTSVQPIVMLGVFSLSATAAGAASPALAGAGFLAAFVVAAIVQSVLLREKVRFGIDRVRNFSAWRDWLANGLYLSPLILLQENLQYAAIFAASLGLGAGDVAIYAIAFRFVGIIRFAVLAVNIAASAKISQAMTNGDTLLRDHTLRQAALLKVPPTVAAIAFVILFAEPILGLFGNAYARGAQALIWFTLIPISAAIFGPNQMLLNIAGYRRSASGASLIALTILVVAVAYSGKVFGVAGAAAATAIVYSLWELSLFVLVRVKTGANASIFPVTPKLIYPVAD
ncbi:MAG: MATE family efflux transporter [Pseudomonadota bacterium]